MSNTVSQAKSPTPLALASLVIFAVLGAAGLYVLWGNAGGGVVKVGAEGVEIQVGAESDFADILDSAMKKDKATVDALLNGHGYFNITQDVEWVSVLRERDEEVTDDVAGAVRNLLFDLSGPFALPDTFDQAKAQLIDALKILDDMAESFEPDSGGQANPFLTEIWRQNLDRTSIFEPRAFRAEVRLLHDPVLELASSAPGPAVVYVCRGSELRGRNIQLVNIEGADGFILTARVIVDPNRIECGGNARTFEQLIAKGTARLWMTPEDFAQLTAPVQDPATLPPRLSATFQVLPRDLTFLDSPG
jgi:hypothetical protein